MKKTALLKILRGLFLPAAGAFTLIALLYVVENWRGARAWAKTKAYLIEQGETLEFSELRPEPVPPEDNFCATRLLASLTDFKINQSGFDIEYQDEESRNRFLDLTLPPPKFGQPRFPRLFENETIDLEAWAQFLDESEKFDVGDTTAPPEKQILAAFSKFESELSEISEATNRPRSWFPVQLGNTFTERVGARLPHIVEVTSFSKFLTIRGSAAVAGGETNTALDCLRIQLKLAEGIGAEPILVHYMAQLAIIRQALTIVWEGQRRKTWTEVDLQTIAHELGSVDLYDSCANAIRGEMTGFFLGSIGFTKHASSKEWKALDPNWSPFAMQLIPDGWLDQNAAIGCEILYRFRIHPLKHQDFSNLSSNPLDLELQSATPYNFLARLNTSPAGSFVRLTIQAQVLLDAARVACALESFYLRNQAYPESLDALIPEFLSIIPEDPMTGSPLRYKSDDNDYRIYSVGLNRKDEGGALFRKTYGKVDRDKGDWVFICERPG